MRNEDCGCEINQNSYSYPNNPISVITSSVLELRHALNSLGVPDAHQLMDSFQKDISDRIGITV